jgi:hypothetical protein
MIISQKGEPRNAPVEGYMLYFVGSHRLSMFFVTLGAICRGDIDTSRIAIRRNAVAAAFVKKNDFERYVKSRRPDQWTYGTGDYGGLVPERLAASIGLIITEGGGETSRYLDYVECTARGDTYKFDGGAKWQSMTSDVPKWFLSYREIDMLEKDEKTMSAAIASAKIGAELARKTK